MIIVKVLPQNVTYLKQEEIKGILKIEDLTLYLKNCVFKKNHTKTSRCNS